MGGPCPPNGKTDRGKCVHATVKIQNFTEIQGNEGNRWPKHTVNSKERPPNHTERKKCPRKDPLVTHTKQATLQYSTFTMLVHTDQ